MKLKILRTIVFYLGVLILSYSVYLKNGFYEGFGFFGVYKYGGLIMELFIILVLTIIVSIFLFILIIVDFNKEELLAKILFCTLHLYSFLVLFLLLSYITKPKAIDVYKGKTTLEITYKDKVPIDSTVVWKNR